MRSPRFSAWSVCLVSLIATLAFTATPAFAQGEAPWWHVEASIAPSVPPGGLGKVLVTATNLGDGWRDGSVVPIAVSDRLPAGVEAIGITSQAGLLGCGARAKKARANARLSR